MADIHKLYASLRRVTPPAVHAGIKKIGAAFLTPLRFSLRTGHFKSALRGAAFANDGEVIPWYTYAAIDLLRQKDFRSKTVLEFGSGNSTLWWGKQASKVVSLEIDHTWYEDIRSLIPKNVTLHHYPDRELKEAEKLLGGERFDVIVVDGFNRLAAMKLAIPRVAERGAIIFDDAEDFDAEDGSYPITELLRREGFARADFYGFAPGVLRRHCTSLAFRGGTFLFDGAENPARLDEKNTA